MTREETKKIIMIMEASYPNFKPSDRKAMLDSWTIILEEYTYAEISTALKLYILSDTKGFAPGPGQLVDKIKDITVMEELNDMEAWALVSRAIKNGNYGAVEEFEKLPETVQKAIGSPDQLRNWAISPIESIESVVQSNFIKTYRTVVERKMQLAKMPTAIRKLIDDVNKDRPLLYQKTQDDPYDNKCEEGETAVTDVPVEKLKNLYEELGGKK